MANTRLIMALLGVAMLASACGGGHAEEVAAARALLEEGRQREAREAATALSFDPPRMVEARLPLARLLIEVDNPQRAVALLKDERLDAEARDVLAWAYLRAGDRVRARREVDAQVAAGRASALTHRIRAELYLQELEPEEARAAVALALDQDPGDPHAYILLAATHLQEQDEATAERVLREARGRFPEDPVVAGSLGERILAVRGDDPGARVEAAGLLELASRKRPLVEGYRERLAVCLMAMEDLPRAEKVLEDLTRDWPDGARHWNRLGRVRTLLGKVAEAVEAFEQAVSRGEVAQGTRLGFYLNLGNAQLDMAERTAERKKWGSAAWKTFSAAKNITETDARVWVGLARSNVETDPMREQVAYSIQLYQRALELDPDSFEANLNIALLYYDLWIRDPEKESEGKRRALYHFRKAEEKVPRSRWSLGARNAFNELEAQLGGAKDEEDEAEEEEKK